MAPAGVASSVIATQRHNYLTVPAMERAQYGRPWVNQTIRTRIARIGERLWLFSNFPMHPAARCRFAGALAPDRERAAAQAPSRPRERTLWTRVEGERGLTRAGPVRQYLPAAWDCSVLARSRAPRQFAGAMSSTPEHLEPKGAPSFWKGRFLPWARKKLVGNGPKWDWLTIIENGVAIAGLVMFSVKGTDLARSVTRSWPGYVEFAVYIFVSYAFTVLAFALYVLLARKLREESEEWYEQQAASTRREGVLSEQRTLISEVQHRVAEVVRRYSTEVLKKGASAIGPGTLQSDTQLRDVLDRKFLPFLKSRLGRDDISIALKYYSTNGEIRTVFRLPPPDATSQRRDLMKFDESVIFMMFWDNDGRQQRVLVRDLAKLPRSPRNEAYQEYGKKCGFNSVIAFPLREPKSDKLGRLDVASILGFVSLDAPGVRAFDTLFLNADADQTNDGAGLEDGPDMHFFFGLADSLATLAVLGVQ